HDRDRDAAPTGGGRQLVRRRDVQRGQAARFAGVGVDRVRVFRREAPVVARHGGADADVVRRRGLLSTGDDRNRNRRRDGGGGGGGQKGQPETRCHRALLQRVFD